MADCSQILTVLPTQILCCPFLHWHFHSLRVPTHFGWKGFANLWPCSSGSAHTWWEMFEEGNWSELHPPLIHIQKENNSASLTTAMWAFRVFVVWADETGEPMLPLAYVAADTTCVVSSRNPLNCILLSVHSSTLGVRKAWQAHRMGRLDFTVKSQRSDRWYSS